MCGLKSHIKVHESQGATLRKNVFGAFEWVSENGFPIFASNEELNRTYSCIQCEMSFKRNQDLRRHKNTYHSGDGIKKYQCQKCMGIFSRTDALFRHNKINRCKKLENDV